MLQVKAFFCAFCFETVYLMLALPLGKISSKGNFYSPSNT